MYGPVATGWVPYVAGFLASNLAAYSGGTGAERGRLRAPTTTCPRGRVSLMTRVWWSGVCSPGRSGRFATGVVGAPTTSRNQMVAYPFWTDLMNPRSSAYLTSSDVAARSTGGENFTPERILMVTVFPSEEICAGPAARSGTALSVLGR